MYAAWFSRLLFILSIDQCLLTVWYSVPAEDERQGQQWRGTGRVDGRQRGPVSHRQGRLRGLDPPRLRQGTTSIFHFALESRRHSLEVATTTLAWRTRQTSKTRLYKNPSPNLNDNFNSTCIGLYYYTTSNRLISKWSVWDSLVGKITVFFGIVYM